MEPRSGDIALGSALAVHNMAMSGGLLDAVQQADAARLDAAEAGFRWLGLEKAAAVIALVRDEIASGAMEDDDRADALEVDADTRYGEAVPSDQTLVDAFEKQFQDDPSLFAPI